MCGDLAEFDCTSAKDSTYSFNNFSFKVINTHSFSLEARIEGSCGSVCITCTQFAMLIEIRC